MVRWSYLLPRLVTVLAMLFFLRFGLDPLVRWSLVQVGQAATGAKVEIRDVRLNLVRGQGFLSDVAVAHPSSPLRNLVQFDRAWFTLDPHELLHKRFVIREGRISGLRVRSSRETSGQLDPADEQRESKSQTASQIAEWATTWLDDFSKRLQGKLEDELESVRLAKDLTRRWPEEYAQLRRRADEWRQRVAELRDLYENLRQNPLGEANKIQQRLAQFDEIRQEIPRLRADWERLQQQARRDREAIDMARHHDVALVREKLDALRMKQPDPAQLAEFLLGEQFTNRLQELALWAREAREFYTLAYGRPDLNRRQGRGTEISFLRGPRRPGLLFQSLTLDGCGRFADQDIQFLAQIRNLTPDPKLLGQPILCQFRCRGTAEFQAQATIDCTGETPREHLVVNCPRWVQPRRVLGKEGKLALEMSPGAAHVWLELDLVADRLCGRLIWKQDDARFVSLVDSQRTGARLAEHLRAVASDIHGLQAVVQLTGTLQRPRFQLHSDLGPQLAQGIHHAVQRELDFRRDQLTQFAQKNLQKGLEEFDQLLQDKQQELQAAIQRGEQELEKAKQKLLAKYNVPDLLKKHGVDLDRVLPQVPNLPQLSNLPRMDNLPPVQGILPGQGVSFDGLLKR